MKKLYHVRATLDYLVSATDRKSADGALCEVMFDANPDEMTVSTTEFNPGDRLPYGWTLDSNVYGDDEMTVADCLAAIEVASKQIPLPMGSHEEETA
jgi:hypothetical protein